jgi:L-serine dehydratase
MTKKSTTKAKPKFTFRDTKELLKLCKKHKMPIWEVMLNYEMETTNKKKAAILNMLQERLDVMSKGIEDIIKNPEMSASGMAGKNAPLLAKSLKKFKKLEKELLLSETALRAMLGAIATGENNARMGTILAFPTAGAAGIMPGVMTAAKEKLGLSDDKMVQMMMTASAVGMIIANSATLSGAAGGCQAEVGSATAMAAAALTEVRGAKPEVAMHAASLALKNMIGLVCDPIGGLVEVPCIKRNGIGAVYSMAASEMAFLGVESYVPFDEVVRAMREAGEMMDRKFRETSLGGLAVTPTGKKVAKDMGLLHIGNNPCTS